MFTRCIFHLVFLSLLPLKDCFVSVRLLLIKQKVMGYVCINVNHVVSFAVISFQKQSDNCHNIRNKATMAM